MARELNIRITVTDTQQARQALAQVEQGLKDVEQAGGKVAASVGDGTKTGTVAGNLAGLRTTIASLGIGLAISNTVEWGSKLSDLSAKTGIGVEALQRFERAGALVGVSLDQMANGVLMLQRRLSEDKNAIAAVEALGMKTSDLLAMKPDEMFVAIGKAVGGIEDPAKRTVAAYELMGRSSAELIPVMVGQIETLTTKHQELTEAQVANLDRFDDAMARIALQSKNYIGGIIGSFGDWQSAVSRLVEGFVGIQAPTVIDTWRIIADKTGAALMDAVRFVQAWYQDVKTWMVDKFATAVVALVTAAADRIAGAFLTMATKAVGAAQHLYAGVKEWIVDRFEAVVNAVKAKVDAVAGFFAGLYDKVVGNSYIPDMVREIGQWMAKLDDEMVLPAARATDDVIASFKRMQVTGNTAVDTMLNYAGTKFTEFGSFIADNAGPISMIASLFTGKGDWTQRLVKGAFGFDLIGMIEKWTGGASPERQTGIPQEEYDRRYGTPEDNYYGGEQPMASGGIVTRPTRALIGEAGPEAVIPLRRGGFDLDGLRTEVRGLRADLASQSRLLPTYLRMAMRDARALAGR